MMEEGANDFLYIQISIDIDDGVARRVNSKYLPSVPGEINDGK